jgi:hypothetical protein
MRSAGDGERSLSESSATVLGVEIDAGAALKFVPFPYLLDELEDSILLTNKIQVHYALNIQLLPLRSRSLSNHKELIVRVLRGFAKLNDERLDSNLGI